MHALNLVPLETYFHLFHLIYYLAPYGIREGARKLETNVHSQEEADSQ